MAEEALIPETTIVARRFTIGDIFKPERVGSLVSAFGLLIVAYIFEHFANAYAYEYSLRNNSSHVGDIILDNLPATDLNFIIVEGALIAIVLGIIFVLMNPRHLLFTLKALALFIAVRSIFISLTHVGIYPDHIAPGLGIFDTIYVYLDFQTGLFFSGHTGLPFLMALIYWDKRRSRILFFALSFLGGASVLMAHIHYSIDVFAAPFIAYGVFIIAKHLFHKDFALIEIHKIQA